MIHVVYASGHYGFDVTRSRAKRQSIQRVERSLALCEDRSAGRTSAAELEVLSFVAVCGDAVVAMLNTRTPMIPLPKNGESSFSPWRLLRFVETYPCMYFNPDFRAYQIRQRECMRSLTRPGTKTPPGHSTCDHLQVLPRASSSTHDHRY